MADAKNQDDTLLGFEDVEDTSLDGDFELEFEDVPEPVDMGFESVAPPEGVLPPPAEGMYSDIKTPSLYQSFKESSLAPEFLAEELPEGTAYLPEALQKAESIYRAYENSPNVEKSGGDLVWVNPEDPTDRRIVPRPGLPGGLGLVFGSDMGPSLGEKMSGSIRNTVRNVAKFGEAAGQNLGIGDDVIDSEALPRLAVDDRSGFFDRLVVEEGAPMLAGGGGGALVVKGLANLPRIVKGLSFAATEGAIFAAGMDENVDTGLIGPNAMIPIYEGLNIDPNSPEADQILRGKFNIFMDTAATTLGIDGALNAGGMLLSAVSALSPIPILRRVLSTEAQEKAIGEDLLRIVADLDPSDANYSENIQRLVQLLEENKTVTANFNIEGFDDVEYMADTATALMRAAENNDLEGIEQAVTGLQALSRANANRPGSMGKQQAAAAQSEQAVVDVLDQSQQVFGRVAEGADQNIDDFTGSVQRVAGEELAMRPETVTREALTARQNELAGEISRLLQEDIPFISKIEDIYRTVGFDTTNAAARSQDQLVDDLLEASRVMTDRKNANYAAVRELGGEIDGEAIFKLINEIASEDTLFNNIDLAVATRSDSATAFRDFVREARLKEIVEEVDGEKVTRLETTDEARERFVKELDTQGVTYGNLFGDISPALSDAIADLDAAGTTVDNSSMRLLEKFQEYINKDALNFAADNSDNGDEILEAAQEATRYFKEDFAPYWRGGGPLEEVDRVRRQNLNLDSRSAQTQSVGLQQTSNLLEVPSNRPYVTQLIELSRQTAGDEALNLNPNSVTDFIIGDVVQRMGRNADRTAEVAGDVAPVDVVQSVKAELQSYANLIRASYPDQYDRIVDFSNRLDDTLGTAQSNRKMLEEAETAFQAAQEDIYNNRYKALFGGGREVLDNPYAQLSSLINSAQGMPQIRTLLESGDEAIIRGVKSAYTQNLRSKIVTAAKNQSGGDTLGQRYTRQALEEITPILSRGEEIFADQPEFMQGLTSLMEVAGLVQQTRTARPTTLAGSNTMQSMNLDKQYQQMVDRQVTLILGPLSRLGARVRTIGKKIGDFVDPNLTTRTIDAALANPDEFIRLIKLVGQTGVTDIRTVNIGTSSMPIRVPVPNAEQRRLLYRYLSRSAIYDGTEEEFNEDYEAALQQNLQDATDVQMQELGLQ